MDIKKSKRTIRTLAAASFLNDLGAEMIYPIWPFFVINILKAPMSALGLIDGIGDAVVALSQAGSGYLSDKLRKRKIFIWLGYLCGSFSRLGYAITTTWPTLIPFRILDRAGKIRGAPRDAMIADLSHLRNRGGNFGAVRMADYLGGVCGIGVCLLLLNVLPYKQIFVIAAVPSMIGVILLMVMIKEPRPTGRKIFRAMVWREMTPNLRLIYFLSAIFALGTFSYSFLLIYAGEIWMSLKIITLLYLGYNLIAAICSLPFGRLADKIGRKAVMFISFILWGLVCLTLMIEITPRSVILALIFYGMHKAAFETMEKTFVSELAPKDFRSSCLGYYQLTVGICALPASLIAGILWDRVGIAAPLYFSAALTVVAAILLIFVKEKRQPHHVRII